MKKKNIVLNSFCAMLIPAVLLFTMGFSERMAAKDLCCAKNNCCQAGIEKQSKEKSNQRGTCDKIICVHFFANQNDKKRKGCANC